MREIFKLELKKLYTMPMVYVLALICILFNIFLFWDGVGYFLEGIQNDAKMLKTDKEQFVNTYTYDSYKALDLEKIKSYATWGKQLSVSARELLDANYEKLMVRMDGMSEEEKNSLSFTGAYGLHNFLFGSLFQAMIIEGMILIGAIVIYSMHFEINHQTDDLVWCTKNGGRLYFVKLLASGVFALGMAFVVMVITFFYYFSMVDYSSVWNSYVSSSFNAAKRVINNLYLVYYPYITWEPMTIAQYFVESLLLILFIYLFTILLIGIMAKRIKNSFFVLASIGSVAVVMHLLSNEIYIPNCLDYLLKFNPVHLIAKSGYWFMDYAPGDSYPFYELLTLFIWTLGAGLGMKKVWKNR